MLQWEACWGGASRNNAGTSLGSGSPGSDGVSFHSALETQVPEVARKASGLDRSPESESSDGDWRQDDLEGSGYNSYGLPGEYPDGDRSQNDGEDGAGDDAGDGAGDSGYNSEPSDGSRSHNDDGGEGNNSESSDEGRGHNDGEDPGYDSEVLRKTLPVRTWEPDEDGEEDGEESSEDTRSNRSGWSLEGHASHTTGTEITVSDLPVMNPPFGLNAGDWLSRGRSITVSGDGSDGVRGDGSVMGSAFGSRSHSA